MRPADATAWVPRVGDYVDTSKAERLALSWLAQPETFVLLASNLDSATNALCSKGLSDSRIVTPRRFASGKTSRECPVLAFYLHPKDMDVALQVAGDQKLVALEWVKGEIDGFVRATGAINLVTGASLSLVVSEQIGEDLNALHRNGNNGWADNYGERDALEILRRMRARGELDVALVHGEMLGRGHRRQSLEHLGKLMSKVNREQ